MNNDLTKFLAGYPLRYVIGISQERRCEKIEAQGDTNLQIYVSLSLNYQEDSQEIANSLSTLLNNLMSRDFVYTQVVDGDTNSKCTMPKYKLTHPDIYALATFLRDRDYALQVTNSKEAGIRYQFITKSDPKDTTPKGLLEHAQYSHSKIPNYNEKATDIITNGSSDLHDLAMIANEINNFYKTNISISPNQTKIDEWSR